MTDIVAEYIELGFDLAIIVTLIYGIVNVGSTMVLYNAKVADIQSTSAFLEEYKKHNNYDTTVVYPQDIVSLIQQTRGYPTVYVTSSKGTPIWTSITPEAQYNLVTVNSLIDQNVMYDATLVKGSNGEVVGYDFRAR